MRRWSHRDRFRSSSSWSSHQASVEAVKTIHDFFHVCESLWRCGWRREEITRILLPRVKGSFDDQCRLKMDSFINNPTNLCLEEFIHLETDPGVALSMDSNQITHLQRHFLYANMSIVVSIPVTKTRVDCYQFEFRRWMLRCLLFLTFSAVDGHRKASDLNDEWPVIYLERTPWKLKTRNPQ